MEAASVARKAACPKCGFTFSRIEWDIQWGYWMQTLGDMLGGEFVEAPQIMGSTIPRDGQEAIRAACAICGFEHLRTTVEQQAEIARRPLTSEEVADR